MGFFDRIKAKLGFAQAVERVETAADAVTPKKASVFKPIFLKFKTKLGARNAELNEQEFDFKSIRRAIDVEPLLRQAREKYLQLIWKNGFSFVGKNQNAVDYVKMRLSQIALVTGTPSQVLFDQIAEEMISYHNVFLVVQRDSVSSGGSPYINAFGKRVNPISGLFLVPASHIEPMTDQKTKQLVGWKVPAYGKEDDKYFLKEEVIHMFMSRAVGNLTGTPMMTPVLGDVRALRRIEESAEALVFQHSFPLIEYKVGTEESPETDPNKFDEIKQTIESSSAQGLFVVPADHSLKAVGNGSSPIDVERYLNYFRLRIISGLGLSTVVFGESDSSNRGTAQVQDKGLQDGAKKYLSTIKTFVNEMLINELLREGNFDVMNPEDTVQLFTSEIDIDAKMKKEVHVMGLYHGNCIAEDEMRKEIGLDPITDEQRGQLYWALVEMPKALIVSRDEAYTQVNAAAGKAPPKPTAGLKVSPGLATKLRPTNQQGPKISSKPAVNASLATSLAIESHNVAQEAYVLMNGVIGRMVAMMTQTKEPIQVRDVVSKEMERVYLGCVVPMSRVAIQGWESIDDSGSPAPSFPTLTPLMSKCREFLQDVGNDATILLEGLQSEKIVKSGESYTNEITSSDIVNIFEVAKHRVGVVFSPIVAEAFKIGESLASSRKENKDGTDDLR